VSPDDSQKLERLLRIAARTETRLVKLIVHLGAHHLIETTQTPPAVPAQPTNQEPQP